MKALAVLVALVLVSTHAIAQSGSMKGMDMKGDTMAKDMGPTAMAKGDKSQVTHKAIGVVRKVDPKDGTVALAHEAIKSLNWPAMTMTFKVQDKAVLDKLAADKKVEVEFQQRGKDYVITTVR